MNSVERRPVVGFEQTYEVSSDGRVRRLTGRTAGRERSLHADAKGYYRVDLWRNGIQHSFWVHQLVARAFIGEPEHGQEVLHGDNNPGNNDWHNLRWGTHVENMLQAVGDGRHSMASKTHCKNGHPLSGENLRIERGTGQRVCRACKRIGAARRYHERRAA